MLKVLLVDETHGRVSALRTALGTVEGVDVTCALDSAGELLRRVAEHAPDIVLVETHSPSRDVLEQLGAMASTAPTPVVMFTDDSRDDAIRAALRAGVSAYVVAGLAPDRIDPIMRVAIERFDADRKLRAELEDTRARLTERKLVERAKGILMKRRDMDEDAAYAALRSLAMERGVRIGEAARQVIDVATLLD